MMEGNDESERQSSNKRGDSVEYWDWCCH